MTRACSNVVRERVVAAMRSGESRSVAARFFDGPVNGDIFRTHVEQALVPTLEPGGIVVMHNLGSHKSQAVRQAIRTAGAPLVFLPPCSPDPNPIEQAFSKLKHWIRGAGARTRLSYSPILGQFSG